MVRNCLTSISFRAFSPLLLCLLVLSRPAAGAVRETIQPEEQTYVNQLHSQRMAKNPFQSKTLKLKNGLEVLLIQDSRATVATAALDVNVGLLREPVAYPGLAHYLEHVLFLGTEKYPSSAEFSEFITKNQGSSNAFTSYEHTNYFFEINPGSFEPALDQFAQFFISPLFDPNYLAKEVAAIESEYQKNIDNNYWRIFHLFHILAKPEHPQSRVFQGNRETIGSVPREVMLKFYREFYHAGNMKLVLMGPLAIDEMESMVRAKFSSIREGDKELPPISSSVYAQEDLPRLLQVKAFGDQRLIYLKFPVLKSQDYSYSDPHRSLSVLLNRKGVGSLLNVLKSQGLITEGSSNFTQDQTFETSLEVELVPSEKGEQNWQQIVQYFFGYINLLKKEGLKKDFYEGQKRSFEISYVDLLLPNGSRTASHFAKSLQIYSSEEILKNKELVLRYSPESFQSLLDFITPDRVQIVLLSPLAKTTLSESRYNLKYSSEPLSASWIKILKETLPHSKMSYPIPNPYVTNNLNLIGEPQEWPTLIEADSQRELWLKTDHTFASPKAWFTFELQTNKSKSSSPELTALIQLYEKALSLSLNRSFQDAMDAGYGVWLSPSRTRSTLTLNGYPEKLELFAKNVLPYLRELQVTHKEFITLKEELIRNARQIEFKGAIENAQDLLYAFIKNENFPAKQLAEAFEKISLEDIKMFAASTFRSAYLKGYGYGSVTPSLLISISQMIQDTFKRVRLAPSLRPEIESIELPMGRSFSLNTGAAGKNQAWILYHQFGDLTPEHKNAAELATSLLSEGFFNALRTERNLGYIVGLRSDSNALFFYVQSELSLATVTNEAETWIQKQGLKLLEDLSPESFAQLKNSVLETLNQPLASPTERAQYFSQGIFSRPGVFDWKEQRVTALKALTQEQFVKTIKAMFDPTTHRRVSVFVNGSESGHPDFAPRPTEELVKDPVAVKRTLPRFIAIPKLIEVEIEAVPQQLFIQPLR